MNWNEIADRSIRGEPPTTEEARALNGIKYYADWDSGYSKQQSTRPQTLGYGLTDSPSGQAAWILEKFRAWTDCDGHPENILGRDELLDNIRQEYLKTGTVSKILTSRKVAKRASTVGISKTLDRDR